jgi:signal transduction histidine kinase
MTHILEPYYSTKAGGTGLGLLIVERIVRGHGGELGIESDEGRGSVFTISLPLRERQVRLLQSRTGPVVPEEGAP